MGDNKHNKLKPGRVYNHSNNMIYVSSNNNKMYIICNKDQIDEVNKRFIDNILIEYEEWDEGKDKKYILTYEITNKKPCLN